MTVSNRSDGQLVSRNRLLRDLLGRPLRDLRLSVIDRCNFRCPYCMPSSRFHTEHHFVKKNERLTSTELLRLAHLFANLGVVKLRITGGEPLLRPNLADLISDLTLLPGIEDVALTTNGVLLSKHSVALKAAGIRRVTVSLDSIDPAIFARMTGGFGQLDDVLAGIAAAQAAALTPIKINTVVQRGVNDDHVMDLLEYFRGTGIVVRLIEYMDVGNRNDWRPEQVVPSRQLMERVAVRWPLSALEPAYRGEVARRYLYNDGGGEIGFISSITQPFCGDCSRARLSSDGTFYTCLFATQGTDLRAPLRAGASDDELLALISATWGRRADRYSELRGQLGIGDVRRVEMSHVGG
jgi:cyclic pyranopterin phosphate synthase